MQLLDILVEFQSADAAEHLNAAHSNVKYEEESVMKHTFPISRLPFHTRSFEKSYGKVRSAEEVCPGIYSIQTAPIPPSRFLGSDLIVVMADSPAVSPAAKAYGTPLEAAPEVLVYRDEDYFDAARWVITYEIDKYLAEHDLPLLDGDSLVEVQARGMEVCPKYFGEFPVPEETPWGPPLRCDSLANGIYWLETAEAGWVLALAYPICDDLLPKTVEMAELNPYDRESGIDNTCGFRFFKYEQSCLPLFELLNCTRQPWSDRINLAALKNAILASFPDYAQKYNQNCIEALQPAELLHTPGAGPHFYSFPAEEA